MGKRVSEDIATKRREIVSALRRRGMVLDEIVAQMSDPYVRINENGAERMLDNPVYTVNPQSGEPFDRSTIARDIQRLRDLANERAAQNADEIRAELLDRSEELFRIAHKQKKYGGALEILKFQAKLTGANRPEKIEHSIDEQQLGKIDRLKELFQTMRQQETQNGNGTTN
jgi:phage terminase large subunit-like protein